MTDWTKYKTTNICIGVDIPVEDENISRVKGLMREKYGSPRSVYSHVSIITAPFPEIFRENIAKEFQEYFTTVKPFEISYREVSYEMPQKFFKLEVGSQLISKVHIDLSEMINKYRGDLLRQKDVERLTKKPDYYNEEQQEMLLKYGFARGGACFHPHITLGDVVNENYSDMDQIKKEIEELLGQSKTGSFIAKTVQAVLHTDSNDQDLMKLLWQKDYTFGE